MSSGLKPVTVKLGPDMVEQIRMMADKRGETVSDVIRHLVRRGLDERIYEENVDLIAGIVRDQLELVLSSHGLVAAAGRTAQGIKSEKSQFDGRVVLRRAFKNHSSCTVEKVQLISWEN